MNCPRQGLALRSGTKLFRQPFSVVLMVYADESSVSVLMAVEDSGPGLSPELFAAGRYFGVAARVQARKLPVHLQTIS